MRYKGLLMAFVVAAAFVATSSALARHSHARHHRHGTHPLKVAAQVSPKFVSNYPPDCGSGTPQNPGLGLTGATTLKYSDDESGTATDGTLTITVTTSDSITFDFSAALPTGDVILAVSADGIGTGGNFYDYRPIGGVLSDTGLHPPAAGSGSYGSAQIKRILFCYGPTPTGPTGPTGATGTTSTPTPPGGATTTAPSASPPATSPPVTPFTAPSKPKKKLKHHAPKKPRHKHAFTG